MSDLAESSALSLTSPQLPVSWYFDPVIYELELSIFSSTVPVMPATS
jgi:hypothetical protein